MKLFLASAAVVMAAGANAQPPPKSLAPKPPVKTQAAQTTQAAQAAPPLAWKTYLNRLENAPVIVQSGEDSAAREQIFLGVNNALLHLDSEGRTQWSTNIGATRARPACDNTRVYMGTDRGAFYAVDQKTGSIVWKALLPGGTQTTPLLMGKLVIVERSDGTVTALQAGSGVIAWNFKRPDSSLGYSSPVGEGGAVFVCGDNTLYKLNAETGKELWRIVLGGKSLGTPSVGGANVFAAGDGSGVCAVNVQTGKLVWRFDGMPTTQADWFGSPLALGSNGTVFVSTYNRYVYALSPNNGKVGWSYRLLGNALSQPVYDRKNNALYVTSSTFRNNPTVTAIDTIKGTKKWDAQAGYVASPPVLSGGTLYAASLNGYLYAYDVR